MWTAKVLAVDVAVARRRRRVSGIIVTIKKPDGLNAMCPDFRCNGKNEDEIVVPLFRNGNMMFKTADDEDECADSATWLPPTHTTT